MIHRSEHSAQNRFAIITRSLAQDKSLSFQARGLLLYVLSKPEGWKARDADLMKQGGIKKHAYQSILSELKAAGYARRVEKRAKAGKFTYSLEIYEEPQFTEVSPLPDNRVADEPVADNPSTDNQVAAIDSTCARVSDTPIIDQQNVREINSARALRAALDTDRRRLFSYLGRKIQGRVPNPAQQAKDITWLLESGYSAEQCEACLDALMAQKWRASATWSTVKNEIAQWLLKQPQPSNGTNPSKPAQFWRPINWRELGLKPGDPKYKWKAEELNA